MINLTTFKPQLVGEGNIDYFLYNNEAIFVEPKIDGIRILLEKRNKEIKLFTRTGKDWTHRFKAITRELAREINSDNIILDGELAVIQEGKITSSNKVLRKNLSENEKLIYFPFDILEIDNQSIFEYPLLTRKQNLSLALNPKRTIQEIPFFCTNSIEDINNFYKKCVEKGMEGIVLKNPKPYVPNTRFNWLKLKPLKTLDLQVINRKIRKDNKGWIYILKDNQTTAKATSNLEIPNGTIVEVKYEKNYGSSLRFPQIIRVREDK